MYVEFATTGDFWKLYKDYDYILGKCAFSINMTIDQKSQSKYWSTSNSDLDFAIWYDNSHWCIGHTNDVGSMMYLIKAPGSSDQWPSELDGLWVYWNNDTEEWIQARNDIKVEPSPLPYNYNTL